ncbi:MAG: hypothetical protein QF535_08530, partial [Anaerolineales bacterium]|nr:hypothetical protein [Anaerolineales bacterium]
SEGETIANLADGFSVIVGGTFWGSAIQRSWNGTIDEVRIYKRALTAEEIRTHYLRGKGFGARGAITADKFRVVNTSGSKQLEANQTAFSITNTSGDHGMFYVDKVNQRVGIGTTAPNRDLEIKAGSPRIRLDASNQNAHLEFYQNGVRNFSLYNFASSNALVVYSGGAGGNMVTFKDDGNVGIGTTAPTDKLVVTGHTNITGNLTVGAAGSLAVIGLGRSPPFSNLGSNTITIYNTTKQGTRLMIGFNESATAVIDSVHTTNSDTALELRTQGTTAIHIDDSQNVGIGTTRPLSKLQVIDNSANVIQSASDVSGLYYLSLGADTTNTAGTLIAGSGTSNNVDLRILTAASGAETEKMRITAAGNVGIGTTSPDDLLHLHGSSGVEMRMSSSGDTDTEIWVNNSGNMYSFGVSSADHFRIYDRTNSAARMVIDSSGNVGIGTDNPDQLVHVQGGILLVNNTNQAGRFIRTDASTTGQDNVLDVYRASTGNMADTYGALIRFGLLDSGVALSPMGHIGAIRDGSDTEGALVFQAGSSGVEEFMRIDNDGNVGIGTTNPTVGLDVQGNSANAGRVVATVADATTGAPALGQRKSRGTL